MIALKNQMRYELLEEQFQIDTSTLFYTKSNSSIERIFLYIYNYTDIIYLEFIDRKVLYDYIKYHQSTHFKEISFIETIRDIKHFLYFLENIKEMKEIPKIDLSIKNFFLWARL
ncbi:hypothetical protein JMM81_04505 [Bacillus sp. V3B]|uniref:hypothetical protein n=1 Tax=Bacillus sp. V3B TaxID=2804915 RepID=UPI00210E81B3|nr:hypothetical protein [Bacillus sp. V3B]MCQ6274238.1 hypothetical protein [Bacillus sp. V3B]